MNPILAFIGLWNSSTYCVQQGISLSGECDIIFTVPHSQQKKGMAKIKLVYKNYYMKEKIFDAEYIYEINSDGMENWIFRSTSFHMDQLFYLHVTKKNAMVCQSFYSCISPMDSGSLLLKAEYENEENKTPFD